jgi:3'(2'), 5'-bisphosphate nucleotidase
MYERELDSAIAAAREATQSILKHYSLNITAEEKIGIDNYSEPVTIADRAASRVIVELLREAFPNDGILSEEEFDDVHLRVTKDRVWIIDPIDGTQGFVNKDGDFAVQIGLAEKGEPAVGVVMVPAHDVTYYASRGGGAWVVPDNDEPRPLRVSGKSDPREMCVATSRNHPTPRMARIKEHFGITREEKRGSVGIKVGLIAEQECDLYINLSPRTKFWDTCAPQIILEEAGGSLTDIYGQRIRYDIEDVQNYGGVVASNDLSHPAIIEGLKPLLIEFGRPKLKAKTGS